MKKFLILACLFVCYHGSSVAAEQSPNIVMIFCDDLTNQALSCYGNSLKLLETPNIDPENQSFHNIVTHSEIP